MSALPITITNVGRAEIINAENTGTDPVTITEVALGTGQYTPNATRVALVAEAKRVNTIAGQVVSDDVIHVTVRDDSSDAYSVNEFGLYTASGTLFAVYSQPSGTVMQKTADSSLLLSIDIALDTLDANSLTFGDTSFSNPPASETVAGVAEIATQAEMDTGEDDVRIVTAKKLKNWAKQATETMLGFLKVATNTQTDAGTADNVAITPKKLRLGVSMQLASNGYIKLPSWLGAVIMQWGTTGGTNNAVVSFPTEFTTACFSVVGTPTTGSNSMAGLYIHSVTKSSFKKVTALDEGNPASFDVRYFAIGV